MACAINSFPVPLSPKIRIFELLCAAFLDSIIIFCVISDEPIIELKSYLALKPLIAFTKELMTLGSLKRSTMPLFSPFSPLTKLMLMLSLIGGIFELRRETVVSLLYNLLRKTDFVMWYLFARQRQDGRIYSCR